MNRAKNRFYRLLKLNKEDKAVVKFYRSIKEKMLREINDIPSKKGEAKNEVSIT